MKMVITFKIRFQARTTVKISFFLHEKLKYVCPPDRTAIYYKKNVIKHTAVWVPIAI